MASEAKPSKSSMARRIPVFLPLAVIALSAFVGWFLTCETETCLKVKVPMLLRLSVPPNIVDQCLPHVIVKPPTCAIDFDKLPSGTRKTISDLSSQVYLPNIPMKTKFEGPRTLPALNITLIAIGSTGDVYPFIPVVKELVTRGHRVRVATHAKFRKMFAHLGADFYPFAFDPMLFMEYTAKQKMFMTCEINYSFKFLIKYLGLLYQFYPATTAPDSDGNPFRTDLVLATPNAHGFTDVAEWLQVPLHAMPAYPGAITTGTFNSEASDFAKPHWTGEDNLFSHVLSEAWPWMMMHPWLNLIRWRYGLPAATMAPRRKTLIPRTMFYSPNLLPPFDDWGDYNEVVGLPFVTNPDYVMPRELQQWLAAGSPPIFFTFGSTIVDNPERLTRVIVQALNETGYRGLIQDGWGGLGTLPEGLPDSVHLIRGSVPHDAIFPACAAVVHHGGTGTIMASLRAQLPSVIVPLIASQPLWAQRISDLGAGTSIAMEGFDVPTLVKAIGIMMQEGVRERARGLGERIAAERGAEVAVDSVLAHLPADFEPGKPCIPWLKAPALMLDEGEDANSRWRC